jgi:isoleucyl-tRNA synthetase
MYVDQYMLSLLKKFQEQVTQDYENYNYDRVMNRTLHFAASEISSFYFTWVKDRLYCDFKESQSRKSCIHVLNEIYLTLAKVLAPVLPYLCEEVHSHYNQEAESLFKSTWFEIDPMWENPSVSGIMEMALDVRTTVNQMVGDHNPKTLWAQILCNEKAFQTLQLLHPTNCSEVDKCTSELCDILQVSGIDLKLSEDKQFSIEPIGVGHSIAGYSVAIGKTEMFQCHRCLKYCCTEGNSMCTRCQSVLNRLQQPAAETPKDSTPPGPEIPIPDPVKEEILLRS